MHQNSSLWDYVICFQLLWIFPVCKVNASQVCNQTYDGHAGNLSKEDISVYGKGEVWFCWLALVDCVQGWVSSQVCSEISRTVAFLNSTIQAYVIPWLLYGFQKCSLPGCFPITGRYLKLTLICFVNAVWCSRRGSLAGPCWGILPSGTSHRRYKMKFIWGLRRRIEKEEEANKERRQRRTEQGFGGEALNMEREKGRGKMREPVFLQQVILLPGCC